VADPAEAVVLHQTDIAEFWSRVVGKFAATDIWVGPKVLYDHRAGDPIWESFFDPTMPVIHLWRRRILDSFISLLIAEATDEWMSQIDAAPDRGPQQPIVFPLERYLRYRKSVQDGFRRVKARTASHERLLQVEYAETADPARLSSRLSAFFGTEARLKQTLRKQNTRPPGTLLANPEAIAPFLQDRLDEDLPG